jgi:DNA-binding MarR family transcriptional regulator
MGRKRAEGSQIRLGRLELFIGFQLRRVQNQLSRDFAAAIAGHQLRSGAFSTLALISANPGISQTRVSRAVGLDKSVTVQIIDELEQRGLAVRRKSDVDRRQRALFTTEDGERYLDELFAILRRTEAAVLNEIRPDELILLHKVLSRMYAIYDDPGG